jgi:hypothetical protein
MEEMIGYCGYSCHLCAARSDDPERRKKLVDGWRKLFGHQSYTVENVKCDGCRADGRIADKVCQARPCAKEKGVEYCALCGDFPCKNVRQLMAGKEGMIVHCYPKTADLSEEEYNICMRQFDSFPNIIRILAKAGKLPDWIEKEIE